MAISICASRPSVHCRRRERTSNHLSSACTYTSRGLAPTAVISCVGRPERWSTDSSWSEARVSLGNGPGGQHRVPANRHRTTGGTSGWRTAVAMLHREHRHRRVQAPQHGGEALVRGRELVADALGLGDVGHRGHPAGLLAARHRSAARRTCGRRRVPSLRITLTSMPPAGLPLQFLLQQALFSSMRSAASRVGRRPDQLGVGEAGHRAERRVDVGDAALPDPARACR